MPSNTRLTSSLRWILLGVAASTVVATVVVLGNNPPRKHHSPAQLAKATAKKYALEAFPSWVVNHPDRDCPARIDELLRFMNDKEARDPWGARYLMLCGANKPKDVAGIIVMSAGPDRQLGTSDDIWSHR